MYNNQEFDRNADCKYYTICVDSIQIVSAYSVRRQYISRGRGDLIAVGCVARTTSWQHIFEIAVCWWSVNPDFIGAWNYYSDRVQVG